MKAKWLICNLGKDRHIQSLYYSVLSCEREAEVVTLSEINDISESPNDEKACVITCGSIWGNTAVKKARPNWVGNWHNKEQMLCSSYYAYWGKYLTQRGYIFIPWAEFIRRKDEIWDKIGIDGKIFVRPDSGEKEFVGQVFNKKDERWLDYFPGLNEIKPNLMCVISQPVVIKKEIRLIIANKKVVAGSTYMIDRHIISEPLEEQSDQQQIVEFAEKVLNDNSPPLPAVHVLDIAVEEAGYSVMEVGCFCCAGLYESDRRKVTLAVSEVAEQEFNTLYGGVPCETTNLI